jgi:hypothetical protein
MAYAANNTLASLYADRQPAPATSTKAALPGTGEGFWARIGTAFMESRRRAAEREIARHRHIVERMKGIGTASSGLPFSRD